VPATAGAAVDDDIYDVAVDTQRGSAAACGASATAAAAAWRPSWQQMCDAGDARASGTDAPVASAQCADAAASAAGSGGEPSPSPVRHTTATDRPRSYAQRRSITVDALTSDSSDSESPDASSDDDDDRYSTECAACDRHIGRSDRGFACDVVGCRSTRCVDCMPAASDYLCRQHTSALGSVVAASADAPARLAVATPAPSAPAVLIRALPEVLSDAARTGVQSALSTIGGWAEDEDMVDLVDDLTDTLQFGPVSSRSKGASAITRLSEYLLVCPAPLRQALASQSAIDILLSSFVNARLRVGRRRNTAVPDSWRERDVPQPLSVRGEVSALLGLIRLAALLSADPRGTVPRTRRVMRKCGCLARHGPSPRSYTFLWELEAAWRHGSIPRNDPTAMAVAGLCVSAIHFLLRPRYVKEVSPAQMPRDGPPGGRGWLLRWEKGDKVRQPHLGPAAPSGSQAGSEATALPKRPAGRAHAAVTQLHPKHPRVSAAEGRLLTELQDAWRSVRGESDGPLFCRVESARQTSKAPPGAVLRTWRYNNGPAVPTWFWLKSKMTDRIIKRWMVRFLTQIIGARRTARRVISGLIARN